MGEAYVAADKAIAEGSGFGDLPLLYVHGEDDPLVPVALARPIVERLGGPNSELRATARPSVPEAAVSTAKPS